ncbi:MAG: YceI family protein [Bacteroidota bacterium]|nr:YceI family protein [Bacteroidota bacterium]
MNSNNLNQIWNIDPAHSRIQFSVRHMVISEVIGNFKVFDLKMKSSEEDFSESEIEFNIDVNSIDTGIPDRDAHLKSDDFFGADKYETISFKSSSLKKLNDEQYKLIGNLTIRNITKPIELDVELGGIITDPWGNERAGFSIRGTISRFDYDLKWNSLIETGGAVVSKNVKIICDVEVIKQK